MLWPIARIVSVLLLGVVPLGCVSSSPYPPAAAVSGGVQPAVSFSDDVSRELVRQTRHLLSLKDRDYIVGPDDVLEISIFEWEMGEQTKSLEFRVAETGVISLPALGPLQAGGKTIYEIQATIEKELSSRGILQNPRVSVSMKEYRSRSIAVVGEVQAPGVYAIHENVSTVMDMLTLAGGMTANAGQIAYVLRKQKGAGVEPLRIVIDLQDLFDRGSFELNAVLQGDDVVYVPKAPLIYVYGNVRQPGGFPMNRSLRAMEALALAGGFADRADRRACLLVRRSAGGQEQTISVNMVRIEQGLDPDVFLRDGDVLTVPESPAKMLASEVWNVVRGIFTFTYRLDSGNN